MKLKNLLLVFVMILLSLGILGCVGQNPYTRTDIIVKESTWIREGQPALYENQSWYPTENIENLTDGEMDPIGTYNNVAFYVEKKQIKPFDRIYSKFGYHKYRVFLKR